MLRPLTTNHQQPATANCLAAGFNLGRDHANLIHARAMRNVDYIRDISKRDIIVAFHEHGFLGAGLEYVGKTSLQLVPADVVVIDLQTRWLPRTLVDPLYDDG